MIHEEYLSFEVLNKPEKDFFKKIQSNAKFKTLSEVLRTKVGINNFYNFSIAVKSSIVMRDIILNSQYISGWARSSQVLNNSDSKFGKYCFLTRSEEENKSWISMMESLEAAGHSMDNMRSLIYLDSVGDYAFNVDLLNLLYLEIVLDSVCCSLEDADMKAELFYFISKFDKLLKEYDVDYHEFCDMLPLALSNFPAINAKQSVDLYSITKEKVYKVNATYSVCGQLWRHRTLTKKYLCNSYITELLEAKKLTESYDYTSIGMHVEIADKVKKLTVEAKSFYDLCQGSILPLEFSGTTGAVHKALSQRTCFINDSPQFKDAFADFEKLHPENEFMLLPPCKLNCTSSNKCYVSYVNESRRRGEEKTQICCPVYAKSHGYEDDFKKACESSKTKWYVENLKLWENVCK